MSDLSVFERLKLALRSARIDFTLTHHAPVYTSAEAAAVRGVSLHSGAKALILKGEDDVPSRDREGARIDPTGERQESTDDQSPGRKPMDQTTPIASGHNPRSPFFMAVIPADLALDSNALRKYLGAKRMRFATKEEVLELTGLTPGSIPPFGSLFGLSTLCDTRLQENERINFNAGSHTDSIQMSYVDYLRYETPTLWAIAKPS